MILLDALLVLVLVGAAILLKSGIEHADFDVYQRVSLAEVWLTIIAFGVLRVFADHAILRNARLHGLV